MADTKQTNEDRRIEFRPLGELDLLDDIVFQDEDVFHWSAARLEDVQLSLIRDAFGFHYERNPEYRRYCDELEISPERIQQSSELWRIPRITSTQFKLRRVRTCKEEEVIKRCVSSGTQGSVSQVYRDEKTLTRFFGSIESGVDQILGLDDAFCVHLGPSQDEAQDLWFSYAMGTTDLLFPIRHVVQDGMFQPELAIDNVRRYWDRHDNMLIIGAPVMMLELLDHMEEQGVTFEDCDKLYFITAGGWKKHSGRAIPRDDMETRLEAAFRGLRRQNVRDFFNMVELNTVFAECEHKQKHVPPWVRIDIFSPETMEPAAEGALGMLSFIDTTAVSYPGFILTDDLGRVVNSDVCTCGRRGPTIEVVRRVSKVESRGCALKIDRQYARSKQQRAS